MPETIEAKVPPKPVFYDFLRAVFLELAERNQTEFPIERRKWHIAFYNAVKDKLIPSCRTEMRIFPYVHNLEEGIYRLMQAGKVLQIYAGGKYKYRLADVNAMKERQDCFEADQKDRLKTTAKYICDKILETS